MIEDRLLARLGWTIPAITITLSTIIHALSGDARAIPFFISEGDYPGLQRIVFTTGLFCAGIILCLVSYRLWKVNLQYSRKFWLHLSLACGIWVGVNISAMAYFNMYDYLDQHIFTSMNVFHFGLAWGVIVHIAIKDGNILGKKLRYASILTSFVAFIGMSVAMANGVKAHPEFLEDMDLNIIQPWVNWAAPFEFLLVIGLMLTLASLESDIGPKPEQEQE